MGLHVKSLRPSMAPMTILPTLLAVVRELPDTVLQVNAHRDVLDEDGARRDEQLAAFLHAAADRGELDLRVHDYLSDDQLWAYLSSLDVSVLPYRFGTQRPHDEQVTTARALRDAGWPVLVEEQLPLDGWSARLDAAARLGGGRWTAWCDGRAAERFAAVVDAVGTEPGQVA